MFPRAFISALFVTVGALAQQPAPGPPAQPAPARIEGRVTTPKGEPVGGATVAIRGAFPNWSTPEEFRTAMENVRNYTVVADPLGRFVQEGVTPGRYQVDAYQTGFVPVAGPALTVDVSAGQRLTLADIKLQNQGAPGKLSGKVLTPAGEAVSRATVTLTGRITLPPGTQTTKGFTIARNRTYTVETDAQGAFSVEGLQPDFYRVEAARNGFTSVEEGPTYFQVASGSARSDVLLRLVRHSAIYGRVLDDYGDPLQGVEMRLYRRIFSYGRWQFEPAGDAAKVVSLVDGTFAIGGLQPGRYYVAAAKPSGSGLAPREPVKETYVTTYYPSVTALDLASGIPIIRGLDARGIDIRMQRAKAFSVQGRIAVPGPMHRAIVRLYPQSPMSTPDVYVMSIVNEDGSFQFFGIPVGAYNLRLSDGGLPPPPPGTEPPPKEPLLTARLDVSVVDRDLNLMLVASPAAEITGTIRVETPPRGGLTSLAEATRTARGTLFLRPLDDGSYAGRASMENETFRIPDILPGSYMLTLQPGSTYLRRLRYDNEDVTRKPFVVLGSGGKLEIEIGTDAGQVTGTVVDDKGKRVETKGLQFTFWEAADLKEGAISYSSYLVTSDSSVTGTLAPGDYFIAAWPAVEGPPGFGGAPEFLRDIQSSAVFVRVESNGRHKVEIKLIPKADVERAVAKLL